MANGSRRGNYERQPQTGSERPHVSLDKTSSFFTSVNVIASVTSLGRLLQRNVEETRRGDVHNGPLRCGTPPAEGNVLLTCPRSLSGPAALRERLLAAGVTD